VFGGIVRKARSRAADAAELGDQGRVGRDAVAGQTCQAQDGFYSPGAYMGI